MPHPFLVTADELQLYGLSWDFMKQFSAEEMDANLQTVTDEALGRMKPEIMPPLVS